MSSSTDRNVQNIINNWINLVNPLFQDLALKLVNEVDWSWTLNAYGKNGKVPNHRLSDYQLFILAKVVSDDIEKSKETGRLKLSPTIGIDEIWHEHLLRPKAYYQMCDVMLANRITKIIDHTPESEGDLQAIKDERIKKTKEMMKFILPSYETDDSSGSSSTSFQANLVSPLKSMNTAAATTVSSSAASPSTSFTSVLGKRSNTTEEVTNKCSSSSSTATSSSSLSSNVLFPENTVELLFGNEPDYPRMIFKIQRSQTVDYVMNHYCTNANMKKEDIVFSYQGKLLALRSTFRNFDNHEVINVVKKMK
jgi:hypothetical protein